MTDKINKYLVSADLILVILIVNVVILFVLYARIKEGMGILFEKTTYCEDFISKWQDERDAAYNKLVTKMNENEN